MLEAIGLTYERIPEAAEQRADYRATDAHHCRYLLEVKQREGGAEKDYERALSQRGEATMEEPMGRLNSISSLIQDAAAQLAATPASDDTLRLMVFVPVGRDHEVAEAQFVATVYGSVDLITQMKDGAAVATPCFYLGFNEFFRLPDLDAVLTILGDQCRLLVNAFSNREAILRSSVLFQVLDAAEAVVDPRRQETEGCAFIADCVIDRRDQAVVIAYVKEKYGLAVAIPFEPTHFKAAVETPDRKRPAE